MRIVWAIVLLMTCLSHVVAQQSNCDQTLDEARKRLSNGHLYGIPAVLKPCIDNGFDKGQKIEAYLILTRTYLLIDDPISAETSYLELLQLDPEHDVNIETDPVDIVYLDKKFTTTPIFIFYGKMGFNYSNALLIQNYGTDNTDLTAESYEGGLGFNLGGGAEWNATEYLSLGFDLGYVTTAYNYANRFFNGDALTFNERQSQVMGTLFFKYRRKINKFYPNAYVGIAGSYLLSSSADISLLDVISSVEQNDGGNETSTFEVAGPEEDMKPQRANVNRYLVAGLGSNFRFGYNYLLVDLRYHYGLNNFVKPGSQYLNDNLVYQYGYVDDYKRLHMLSLSVGWIVPRYKPRKIKEASGLFSRLFKK